MTPRIFLSYARKDGGVAAKALIDLLAAHGHSAWQDLRDLGPEETVWPQIERALRGAEFLILLVTPAALTSDYIRKEWREARRQGATILPVMAMDVSRSALPRWLRRGEVYNLNTPEHLEKFTARLNSIGGIFRADWDAGLEIESFVKRPNLFAQIKDLLLSDTSEPVSLISALEGRGGYGKSVLAGEIARDPDIRDAYIDGVFWISLGQENPDVPGKITHLITRITGKGGAMDVTAGAEELRRLLEKRNVLIILDDVWRKQDIDPFAKATGKGAASLLATTRKSDALPGSAKKIDVSGMEPEEALGILSSGLLPNGAERVLLANFARDFWYWPQLLAIANGILRGRLRDGDSLTLALEIISHHANQDVIPGEDERGRAIANVMQMGIDDLPEAERAWFRALAVVPEDTAFPVAIVAPLWGMKPLRAEEFAAKLLDRRLIQSRDLTDKGVGARIRMHDDMLWYLRVTTDDRTRQDLHAAMLAAHLPPDGAWPQMNAAENPALIYLWRHLLWHLEQAGQTEAAMALRLDYDWIKAKLHLLGVDELRADYRPRPAEPVAALVGNALDLSSDVLDHDAGQLGFQLYGRLNRIEGAAVEALCQRAKADVGSLDPVALSLTPPGAELMRLRGHEGRVRSVTFTPDGRHIVSGDDKGTLRFWDATTGALLGEPHGWHDRVIFCVGCAPDGSRIVSGNKDGTLHLWDVKKGSMRGSILQGHTGSVWSVAFSPDCRSIVSGGNDSTLRVWDAAKGTALGQPLRGHNRRVLGVAFAPDGRSIVSGAEDGTLRLWDCTTGAALSDPLFGHEGAVLSVAFAPDSRSIVSGGEDGTLRLWDANTGLALGDPLRGHVGWVRSVAFAPDGDRIVSGSDDGTLRLWDATTGTALGDALSGHEKVIYSVAFAPDGLRIVSGGRDSTVRLWDATIGAARYAPRNGHSGSVRSVAFSHDGNRIVSGSSDGTLRLWDADNGAALGDPLHGHHGWVLSAAFAPDGRRIISGGTDGTLRLWDGTSWSSFGVERPGWENPIFSVAFSPDGRSIVCGGTDGSLLLWDAKSRAAIGDPLRGHKRLARSVAFSPDGRSIVSGSGDGTVRIWDAATGGALSQPMRGHWDWVNSVAFGPDGRRIVSGGADHRLRLWDATTGAALGNSMRGHSDRVNSVAFTFDGKCIVSGGDDRTLRLWDATSGRQERVWTFDSTLHTVAVSRDHFAVGDALGHVHILRWR